MTFFFTLRCDVFKVFHQYINKSWRWTKNNKAFLYIQTGVFIIAFRVVYRRVFQYHTKTTLRGFGENQMWKHHYQWLYIWNGALVLYYYMAVVHIGPCFVTLTRLQKRDLCPLGKCEREREESSAMPKKTKASQQSLVATRGKMPKRTQINKEINNLLSLGRK